MHRCTHMHTCAYMDTHTKAQTCFQPKPIAWALGEKRERRIARQPARGCYGIFESAAEPIRADCGLEEAGVGFLSAQRKRSPKEDQPPHEYSLAGWGKVN